MAAALLSPKIGELLEHIVEKSKDLEQRIHEFNNSSEEIDVSSFVTICNCVYEVVNSDDEEIMDNIITIFHQLKRPNTKDKEYHILYIADAISEIRDLLMEAYAAGQVAGLQASQLDAFIPKPVSVPMSSIGNEVTVLRNEVIYIDNEYNNLTYIDNRTNISILSFFIKNMKIKIDIAKAILAAKDLLDASGLLRILNGLIRICGNLVDKVIEYVPDIYEEIRGHIAGILNKARAAFASVREILDPKFAKDEMDVDADGREWAENEIRDLLVSGRPVPQQAVPYIRRLVFHPSEHLNLLELSKLSEIRELTLTIHKHNDVLFLSKLSQMEALFITIASDGVDLAFLSHLKNIKMLSISSSNIDGLNVIFPETISSEKMINLNLQSLRGVRLPRFRQADRLAYIELKGIRFSDWAEIGCFRNAKRLVLRSSNISDISALGAERSLEELDIRRTKISNCRSLRDYRKLKRILVSRTLKRPQLDGIPKGVDIVRGPEQGKPSP